MVSRFGVLYQSLSGDRYSGVLLYFMGPEVSRLPHAWAWHAVARFRLRSVARRLGTPCSDFGLLRWRKFVGGGVVYCFRGASR